MANTTRIATLKSGLVDALQAVDELSDVQIASADIGDETDEFETIQFIGEDLIDQEWGAIGNLSRDEQITLRGVVQVVKPGAGETVIREARDRAAELLGYIEDYFSGPTGDPRVGNRVHAARCRPVSLQERVTTSGRVALLFFEVQTGKTRLART